jgi:hypothetical protein
MAQLNRTRVASPAEQHRHQLVVPSHQRLIGVHVDHVDREHVLLPESLQRQQHVITKMAIGARVQSEMNQGLVRLEEK